MTYGGKSKWIRLCNFFCIQNPGADTRLTQEKNHGIMIAQQKTTNEVLRKTAYACRRSNTLRRLISDRD